LEMSDRIRAIVAFVQKNPGEDLNQLVASLVPNPSAIESEPSPEELGVLKDLRWMIREGYITEFSNGELHLGLPRQAHSPKKKVAAKKPKEAKQQTAKPQAKKREETPAPIDKTPLKAKRTGSPVVRMR